MNEGRLCPAANEVGTVGDGGRCEASNVLLGDDGELGMVDFGRDKEPTTERRMLFREAETVRRFAGTESGESPV